MSCKFHPCLQRSILNTTLRHIVCQNIMAGLWVSLVTAASSINKTDCQDLTEFLLKIFFINTVTHNLLYPV